VLAVLLTILGLTIGGALGDFGGAILGGVAGLILGLWKGGTRRAHQVTVDREREEELRRLKDTVTRLQVGLSDLQKQVEALAQRRTTDVIGSERLDNEAPVEPPTEPLAEAGREQFESSPEAPTAAERPTEVIPMEAARVAHASESAVPPMPDSVEIEATVADRVVAAIRGFFLGGNTVARVGIMVLLIGVTLLLKYAAEHSLFPIELRMASAALIGMVLVGVGVRMRQARPGFSRTLQGGGVATMYLVVFFSFRVYHLIPGGLAFGLLAAIAVASGVLAVTQDALALIVIGQVGGFLAPILASSGGGSHVALFSYYLLLNVLVFSVAWFRAWRPLNLIGFAFTFGIGTAWGVMRYSSEQFATTEPFLIAFFFLYLAIPVLFAIKHSVQGWVDGSLIFGTPLAFLSLQLLLVEDIPFAMAYTALGLGAVYIALARWLFKRAPALPLMAESFLALGVAFATLAVPYAVDNAGLTGATWALEGAGLYWVGIRQRRKLSRIAGVALQGLSGGAVIWYLTRDDDSVSVTTLACALLCASTLFIAHHAYKKREQEPKWWRALQLLIVWGLLFFVPAVLREINERLPVEQHPGAIVGALGILGIVFELVGRKLDWLAGRCPAVPLVLAIVPLVPLWDGGDDLLTRGGFYGWPLLFTSVYLTLKHWVPQIAAFRPLHPWALWSVVTWLGIELYRVTANLDLHSDWGKAAFAIPAVVSLALVVRQRDTARWPIAHYRREYLGLGALGLCFGLLGWSVLVGFTARGVTDPLSYIPLLNAIDISSLLGFAAVIFAWHHGVLLFETVQDKRLQVTLFVAIVFFWFNAMLARSVVQLAGVPFAASALWASVGFQMCLSISWSLIGLGTTLFASRRGSRKAWMAGVTLLGVVVVKLFIVDLGALSALAKIGTFLVVGMLLLVVGRVAPVPPQNEEVAP
jgi:uncharacterized membrane protein